MSQHVGFEGQTPKGKGELKPQMEEREAFFPALSCDSRAFGGSCAVGGSPQLGRPVRGQEQRLQGPHRGFPGNAG